MIFSGYKFRIYLICLLAATSIVYCNSDSKNASFTDQYLNLQDSVQYMGMETCQSCHANVHETFIETGMGKSFDKATLDKSGATFEDHDVVYDQKSNFYYKPYFEKGNMYVMEYRLEGKDTIHKRIEEIDYIVGSGQHTNSHIINENGYFYQAPITYYTQEKHWDMAPSFDRDNQRFSRFLTPECITCHNHFPSPVSGSLNKYSEMPTGIECERCHGPGEIHVLEKLAGNHVDTSKHIDYTIVNPSDLPKDLQMDLCQRCHLQGIPVLEDGMTFFDFKPGMKLSSVMNVFLPRYTNSDERFIMASQADRLRLSKCYTMSEDLTCLTCHHPHHSVLKADKSTFNLACKNCHSETEKNTCIAPMSERNAKDNNCVSCHMPPSSSIDIPHVKITDHYINRITDFNERQISEHDKNEIARFLGLKMLTKDNPTALEMAKGYLAMHDKNVEATAILDSAFHYLNLTKEPLEKTLHTWIHFYFTKKDFRSIAEMAKKHPSATINNDWTAYRMGEAFYILGDQANSLLYYKKATQISKFNLDFQEKLGINYLAQGSFLQAKKTFEFVLKEHPKRTLALTNLGLVHVNLKQFEKGEEMYDKAIGLDPDNVQALLNKAELRLYFKDKKIAQSLLAKVLNLDPNNKKAKELLLNL